MFRMNYGAIKKYDIANGTGVRVSLFVSGCTHHCPGCFNSETWDFNYGKQYTSETQAEILAALDFSHISGLTLIGGEPMEPDNQRALLPLLKRIRAEYPGKTVWCFTGYTLDEHILAKKLGAWEVTEELLTHLDVLVDGPFVAERKNLRLRFRGSENQRLIDMKKTLATGEIVLWEDWQSEGGAKE